MATMPGCSALLCRSSVNGSREASTTLATQWDPQLPPSTAETCRDCCGSLLSSTAGIIWPARGQGWAAMQSASMFSVLKQDGCIWLQGLWMPAVCLALPWALPMEKHCWGAATQHRWGAGSLPWQGAGPAQGCLASLSTQLCTEHEKVPARAGPLSCMGFEDEVLVSFHHWG